MKKLLCVFGLVLCITAADTMLDNPVAFVLAVGGLAVFAILGKELKHDEELPERFHKKFRV